MDLKNFSFFICLINCMILLASGKNVVPQVTPTQTSGSVGKGPTTTTAQVGQKASDPTASGSLSPKVILNIDTK